MIATPSGPRYILAECVVDATGSADIAIAAGASYMFVDGETIAYQGVGLPPTDLYVDYFNTDFAITDDLDTIDTTHLRVYGKNKYKDAFDISSMICSRERRRIVGDFVMTVEDQLARRTYTDSIAHTYSNHDSHASKNALWYFLMARPQKLYCYLPFRCMLPKGLNGIVVTGTGISAQHDAMAILRMQADMQNQGYAAGVAAAMASRQKGSVRAIDVKDLQRHLIAKGNIPASVLTDKDNSQLSLQQIESILPEAVKDYYIETYSERKSENVAPLLVNFDKTMPLIKKKYLESSDESEKLFYAHFMAVFGEDAGIDTLIKAINDTSWDAGGNTLYVSTVDRLVIAAGMAGNKRATASIIDKLNELEPDSPFSHFQAVALALQNLKDPAACKPLADTLAKKGMTGHHVTTIEEADRQDYEARKIQPNEFSLDTRMLCDREIILARALLYSGDHNGLGRKILENYLTDLRGVYAAAARACLIEAEKKN
jgi:hypothetical protein